jgi:formate dehydrogenase major subunit
VDGERSNILSLKGEANSQSASLMGLEQPFNPNGEKVTYIAIGDDYVANRLVEKASKSAYLVVQASYESKLTEQADVVLPVSIWAEQEGHYINLDGRIRKAEKVIDRARERARQFGCADRTCQTNEIQLGCGLDENHP